MTSVQNVKGRKEVQLAGNQAKKKKKHKVGTQRLQFRISTRTDAVFSQHAKGGVLLLVKGFDLGGGAEWCVCVCV